MDINTVRNALKIAGFTDADEAPFGFVLSGNAEGLTVVDYSGPYDHRQTMLNGYVAALLAVGNNHEVFQVRMTGGKVSERVLVVEPRVIGPEVE